MSHLSEEDLILRYYGEAEAPADAAAHLAECAACRAADEALRLTLTAADGLRVPERGAGYGGEVWARLAPKLDDRRGRVLGFERRGRWVSLLAAAAALVAAFEAGRHFQPAHVAPPPQRTASAPVRERILLVAVGDHLRRAQMVRVELVNAKDEASLDVSAEREQARNLVADSRLYRRTAASTGETAVASVLDDLERVLVEIANGPDTLSPQEVKDLRDRIESKGILFKVKVLGSQVQDREKKTVRGRAGAAGTKT
jgi:hypothetical protein